MYLRRDRCTLSEEEDSLTTSVPEASLSSCISSAEKTDAREQEEAAEGPGPSMGPGPAAAETPSAASDAVVSPRRRSSLSFLRVFLPRDMFICSSCFPFISHMPRPQLPFLPLSVANNNALHFPETTATATLRNTAAPLPSIQRTRVQTRKRTVYRLGGNGVQTH